MPLATRTVTSTRKHSRSRSRSSGNGAKPSISASDRWLEETLKNNSLTSSAAVEAALPLAIRRRFTYLAEIGVISQGDFDLKSMGTLYVLDEPLQEKVLDYLESERAFFAHSRSKSGFLVAACEKARRGAIDARGVGNEDPWRSWLLSIAVPRRPNIALIPEKAWLKECRHSTVRIIVDVSVDPCLGVQFVALALRPTQSAADIKNQLASIGAGLPVQKMALRSPVLGFLKDHRTLAFYNMQSGSQLLLKCKTRAGVALKKDQSAYVRPIPVQGKDAFLNLAGGGPA